MVNFIDHATASIVLYKKDNSNCWLCTSNRLYQALIRGIPVIVGINPPMANLVNKYNCGIVLEGSGNRVGDIKNGIRQLIENHKKYKKNTKYYLNDIYWESQMHAFKNILKIKKVNGA